MIIVFPVVVLLPTFAITDSAPVISDMQPEGYRGIRVHGAVGPFFDHIQNVDDFSSGECAWNPSRHAPTIVHILCTESSTCRGLLQKYDCEVGADEKKRRLHDARDAPRLI
jgi:hypothetical protein